MIIKFNRYFLLVVIALFFSFDTAIAAICALRVPDRDVYRLFPQATGYKSVVAELDKKGREEIEELLGQSLELNDIGIFTFYIILKEDLPIGFIHPHAERGTYGNVEIIWAFNLDGSIKDYLIQRSRERETRELKSEEFRSRFRRKRLGDPFTITNSRDINPDFIRPINGRKRPSSIIAYGAKKILTIDNFLFGEVMKAAREKALKAKEE